MPAAMWVGKARIVAAAARPAITMPGAAAMTVAGSR
jgi:hypothetical protein